MAKPKPCRMQVECCEACKEWEPIPFHDNGGLCLMEGRTPLHKALHGAWSRSSDEASTRPMKAVVGLR